MDIAPGTVVAGKYLVERPLARPDHRLTPDRGSVWVARAGALGCPVALKLLHAAQARSPEFLARFERDVRAAAALQTRHVVRVHDHGIADGAPYVAMDLLFGEDLATRLLRRARLPVQDALRVLAQCAEALRCAHGAGLIHRDVRPASLFFARGADAGADGEGLKVLDFGLAGMGAPLKLERAAGDLAVGALHYLSPEQIRGERGLDAQADLWSLAAVLFQMITGHLPFKGDTASVVASKILLAPAPSATERAPRLPRAVDGFFERAFARERARRFRSADEMVEAFARVVDLAPPPSSGVRPPVSSRSAAMDRVRVRIAAMTATKISARANADRSAQPPPLDPPRAASDTQLNAERPDVLERELRSSWGRWLFSLGLSVIVGASAILTLSRIERSTSAQPALPSIAIPFQRESGLQRGEPPRDRSAIASPGSPVAVGAAVPAQPHASQGTAASASPASSSSSGRPSPARGRER